MIGRLAAVCLLASVALASDSEMLSLSDLNGNPQTLESYRGRVVVLNFWATWCVPCREEMPLLVNIQKRYESKGVVVIGADDEGTQAQIPPFIQKLNITFHVWKSATTEHMERLGLGKGLPATAVIGPDGQIVFRILGIERKALTERLDWLLGDQKTPVPAALIDGITGKETHAHEHSKVEHTHGGIGMEGASTVPS